MDRSITTWRRCAASSVPAHEHARSDRSRNTDRVQRQHPLLDHHSSGLARPASTDDILDAARVILSRQIRRASRQSSQCEILFMSGSRTQRLDAVATPRFVREMDQRKNQRNRDRQRRPDGQHVLGAARVVDPAHQRTRERSGK